MQTEKNTFLRYEGFPATKRCRRYKINYHIQHHLLQDFESVSDHLGILGIKELRIFLKRFSWNLLLFFTISKYFNIFSVSLHLYISIAMFSLLNQKFCYK